MIYLSQIGLIAFNIWMAWYHSKLIKKGITPKHGWWGLLYFVVAAILCLVAKSWWLVLLSLLIRKVVFDLALNKFRGKKWFYVSTSTTSIIDDFHNSLFGKRSEIYITLYALGIVVINLFR